MHNTLSSHQKTLILLKKGVWLYFWLLIFEGALRKWVLPFLATPLLLVREPIALWLLVMAYYKGFFKPNLTVVAVWIISILAVFFALIFGHGKIGVALYGARILLIQFPLIYIIPSLFTRQDVIKMGENLLWVTIIMTVIIGMQFYSPQSAFINKGIGGEEVEGFSGGLGFFRPPGTFSFTNGLAAYYGLAAAFIFYFWLDNKVPIKRWLLLVATGALLMAIPLSISRTMLGEVALSAVFAVAISLRKPEYIGRIILAGFGVVILFLILANTSFFQTGIEAFTSRFESASDYQESGVSGTIGERIFGGMIAAVSKGDELPFWGYGIGMGTNAGAKLMTGKVMFLLAEDEWSRMIAEMGILMGLIVLALRLQIVATTLANAYKSINKNNVLPWMLISYSFLLILQGQWAQPTALGFAVLSGGLNLASFKYPTKERSRPATQS